MAMAAAAGALLAAPRASRRMARARGGAAQRRPAASRGGDMGRRHRVAASASRWSCSPRRASAHAARGPTRPPRALVAAGLGWRLSARRAPPPRGLARPPSGAARPPPSPPVRRAPGGPPRRWRRVRRRRVRRGWRRAPRTRRRRAWRAAGARGHRRGCPRGRCRCGQRFLVKRGPPGCQSMVQEELVRRAFAGAGAAEAAAEFARDTEASGVGGRWGGGAHTGGAAHAGAVSGGRGWRRR